MTMPFKYGIIVKRPENGAKKRQKEYEKAKFCEKF